jgi:hypothetical protein
MQTDVKTREEKGAGRRPQLPEEAARRPGNRNELTASSRRQGSNPAILRHPEGSGPKPGRIAKYVYDLKTMSENLALISGSGGNRRRERNRCRDKGGRNRLDQERPQNVGGAIGLSRATMEKSSRICSGLSPTTASSSQSPHQDS